MENLEKYKAVFMESFDIDETKLNESLTYQSIPVWDSVGHMGMIAGLEDTFNIMMETEDIIEFSSYEKGKEILAKYKITIQ
jgi:acyl carrier protein